jgi:Txe/YoeB family toxin of toxin-antitoxin system
MYELYFSPKAKSDAKKLTNSGLDCKAKIILELIKNDPYHFPPGFEFLKGKLKGFISRRINQQHRIVYKVIEDEKIIKVNRMWTHYE